MAHNARTILCTFTRDSRVTWNRVVHNYEMKALTHSEKSQTSPVLGHVILPSFFLAISWRACDKFQKCDKLRCFNKHIKSNSAADNIPSRCRHSRSAEPVADSRCPWAPWWCSRQASSGAAWRKAGAQLVSWNPQGTRGLLWGSYPRSRIFRWSRTTWYKTP